MTPLTRTEHRMFQVLLHFKVVSSELLKLAIDNGGKSRKSYPSFWMHALRPKLAERHIKVVFTLQAYRLSRTRPLRDRAAYMRQNRPSRAIARTA